MRYRPDHKLHAHQRLATRAARLAKANGFAAMSLRQLMSGTGLSTGAFYAIFECKESLLRSIIELEIEQTLRHFDASLPPTAGSHAANVQAAPHDPAPVRSHVDAADADRPRALAADAAPTHDTVPLMGMLAAYLHPAHAIDLAGGCVLPALAAEVARADVATRRACEKGLRRLQHLLTRQTEDSDAAWGILSGAVGGVLLARTLSTASARDELLAAVLRDLNRQLRRHAPTAAPAPHPDPTTHPSPPSRPDYPPQATPHHDPTSPGGPTTPPVRPPAQ